MQLAVLASKVTTRSRMLDKLDGMIILLPIEILNSACVLTVVAERERSITSTSFQPTMRINVDSTRSMASRAHSRDASSLTLSGVGWENGLCYQPQRPLISLLSL